MEGGTDGWREGQMDISVYVVAILESFQICPSAYFKVIGVSLSTSLNDL